MLQVLIMLCSAIHATLLEQITTIDVWLCDDDNYFNTLLTIEMARGNEDHLNTQLNIAFGGAAFYDFNCPPS